MLIFFDIKGNVDKEFVLVGQAVNFAYYYDVLWRLRKNVRRLRPKLQRQKKWLFHMDNAPSRTSFFTMKYLTKNNLAVVVHPTFLCFPD
jgi:hypothetical protein